MVKSVTCCCFIAAFGIILKCFPVSPVPSDEGISWREQSFPGLSVLWEGSGGAASFLQVVAYPRLFLSCWMCCSPSLEVSLGTRMSRVNIHTSGSSFSPILVGADGIEPSLWPLWLWDTPAEVEAVPQLKSAGTRAKRMPGQSQNKRAQGESGGW